MRQRISRATLSDLSGVFATMSRRTAEMMSDCQISEEEIGNTRQAKAFLDSMSDLFLMASKDKAKSIEIID